MDSVDCVVSYFRTELNKNASSVKINNTITDRCDHCGYGEILIGEATLLNDDSDNSSSDNSSSDENINFVYKTGCLSYDGEMTY